MASSATPYKFTTTRRVEMSIGRIIYPSLASAIHCQRVPNNLDVASKIMRTRPFTGMDRLARRYAGSTIPESVIRKCVKVFLRSNPSTKAALLQAALSGRQIICNEFDKHTGKVNFIGSVIIEELGPIPVRNAPPAPPLPRNVPIMKKNVVDLLRMEVPPKVEPQRRPTRPEANDHKEPPKEQPIEAKEETPQYGIHLVNGVGEWGDGVVVSLLNAPLSTDMPEGAIHIPIRHSEKLSTNVGVPMFKAILEASKNNVVHVVAAPEVGAYVADILGRLNVSPLSNPNDDAEWPAAIDADVAATVAAVLA